MRIARVEADLHVFEGEVKWQEPLLLAVRFDDQSHLRLRISGDGASLIVDREQLTGPIDMQEYGKVEIHDVTDRLDPDLRNTLTSAPLAIMGSDRRLVGMALPGEHAEHFCIWVCSDLFFWGPFSRLNAHAWPANYAATIHDPLTI